MKTIALILSIAVFSTLNAMGQKINAEKLLKNKNNREQIFSCILNNHEMITQFMNQAEGNEHAMNMMNGYFPAMHRQAGNHKSQDQTMMNQGTTGMNHSGQHMMNQTGSTNMHRGHQMAGTRGDSLNCGYGSMAHQNGMTGMMGMMNMMADHHPEMMTRMMTDMPDYCSDRIENCPYYPENRDLNQDKTERK